MSIGTNGSAIDKYVSLLKESGIRTLEDLIGIIEHSYDGIFITSPQGEFLYTNVKAVERISGTTQFEKFENVNEIKKAGVIVEESICKLNKRAGILIEHKLKTGVEAFITSVPVYDEKGECICFVANYREIMALEELRRELVKTKSQSETYLRELTELRNRVHKENELITRNVEMLKVLESLVNISPTDATVSITGESGAGKEVVAKLIHKMSNRKDGPFVQINCGAIPENLLESELFGYEKGSFTGAHHSGKKGILETAQDGTVMLDEIGDLPLRLQVKLLKVFQNRKMYRIGGTIPIELDVRIICATNKDLEAMVESGEFREDLFYRINVIPLHIPPLRDRKEDIIPLAQHFLKRMSEKYDKQIVLSEKVSKALVRYHWPGNIRELENIIERMVIISRKQVIDIDLLPNHIAVDASTSSALSTDQDLRQAVSYFELGIIKDAIEKHGSIRRAAKQLNVSHSTIVKKLKRYANM